MARGFKTLLSIVLFLIMAGAGPALCVGTAVAAQPVRILALGSSLTQGYGLPPGTEFTTQLQAALKQAGVDAVVTNAGVSGDTSAGGLARLDWSLADHPDAVILELGSNDMLRGIPPDVTEKNLRAILDKLKAEHVRVLLTGMHAQRNLGADYVKQFDAIYPRLAKDYTVLFYPFFLDGVALNPKLNQADGMHPNPAGVKVVVARMLPYVKKLVLPSKSGR
ncbi:MAG TPA: arylesterase [Rhizomicrobium sp.]|jgi:acyl-CoA thioesterase-1|nr:arylesterase [Rhizomicrobium sp.]